MGHPRSWEGTDRCLYGSQSVRPPQPGRTPTAVCTAHSPYGPLNLGGHRPLSVRLTVRTAPSTWEDTDRCLYGSQSVRPPQPGRAPTAVCTAHSPYDPVNLGGHRPLSVRLTVRTTPSTWEGTDRCLYGSQSVRPPQPGRAPTAVCTAHSPYDPLNTTGRRF